MMDKLKHYGLFALPLLCIIPIVVYGFFILARGPEPPLEYTQHEYQAERTELAPGDTLIYTPTLYIRAAGRIDILRTFWSVDRSADAVLCSGEPAPIVQITRNRPRGILNNFRGGSAVKLPIPNLPPGDYLLLSSASGPGRGQSDYQVKFSIRRKCG